MSRHLSSLLRELSDLGNLIFETQDLLKQLPGDKIVELQLMQLKYRQSELSKELEEFSIGERRQVLEYHFHSTLESGVTLNDIAKSCGALSNILDAVSKHELQYSGSLEFELRTVVNQSLGLVFTSKQADQMEVGELVSDMNKTERVMNEFMSLTAALNEEDPVSLFREQRRRKETILALNKFYESIQSSGNDVSINWISPFQSEKPKQLKVTNDRAKHISSIIKNRQVMPEETVVLYGELGGISIYRQIIEFLERDTESPININWPETLLPTITELKLNRNYHVTCVVNSKLDASTDSVRKTHTLKDISE